MKSETIDHLQDRINQTSDQNNKLTSCIRNAKSALLHLANHMDEYSSGRLQNEIIAIAEETLSGDNL